MEEFPVTGRGTRPPGELASGLEFVFHVVKLEKGQTVEKAKPEGKKLL